MLVKLSLFGGYVGPEKGHFVVRGEARMSCGISHEEGHRLG